MAFPLFFLLSSAMLLVSALFVIRHRDAKLRSFGIAGTVTTLLLLATALVRLLGRVDWTADAGLLVEVVTLANLSGTAVLLATWTARLRA